MGPHWFVRVDVDAQVAHWWWHNRAIAYSFIHSFIHSFIRYAEAAMEHEIQNTHKTSNSKSKLHKHNHYEFKKKHKTLKTEYTKSVQSWIPAEQYFSTVVSTKRFHMRLLLSLTVMLIEGIIYGSWWSEIFKRWALTKWQLTFDQMYHDYLCKVD